MKNEQPAWAELTVQQYKYYQGYGWAIVIHPDDAAASISIGNAPANLNKKNIELQNINKELQSFVCISSHGLQGPLHKIQTFAARLIEKEYDNVTESEKDQFRRIQESGCKQFFIIYWHTHKQIRHKK